MDSTPLLPHNAAKYVAFRARRFATAWPNSVAQWQLVILIALAVVRGLIYLSLFPPWVAPDEPAHFETIRIIGQEGEIPYSRYYESTPVNPELSVSFLTFRMWELLERPTPSRLLESQNLTDVSFANYPYPGKLVPADSYPILPHMVLSPLSNLASPLDIATELYILRLVSIVLAVAVTIIAWGVTKKLFPNRPQFWLAIPAFIVFLPMYTHIFASVNTDVFATLLGSMLLFLLISFFDTRPTKLKIGLVVGLLFLALLTKRTLVFTILWAGLVAILYVGYRRQWAIKRIVIAGLAVVLFITIGLAWVILNPQVLDNSIINMFNINIAKRFAILYLVEQGASLPEILELYVKSGLFAFITFWGNFGGATTNIPWPWAWGLMALCAVVLFGAARYLYRAFTSAEGVSRYQQNIFIVFVAGIVLSLLNAFFPVLVAGPSWGPPARYFFPMIIPIATFFFLGTWHLFPARYRQIYLLPLWLAALVTYDALVVSRVLIPFLYG